MTSLSDDAYRNTFVLLNYKRNMSKKNILTEAVLDYVAKGGSVLDLDSAPSELVSNFNVKYRLYITRGFGGASS